MNDLSKLEKEFTISSYELNPGGKARLSTLANYFQEVAYHHANLLGLGYEAMKNRNTVWLLSRMKIRISSYPGWNDHVLVRTWPSGISKLFAKRDFSVISKDGRILGIATTCWLIVDLDTHRPLRPGRGMENYSRISHGPFQFENELDKIEKPAGEGFEIKRRVVCSNLDIMGHVNNVKYIEWCLDQLSGDGEIREVREFEINYLHESRLNETIAMTLLQGEGNQVSVFSGRRGGDGEEVFRARASW